MIEKKVPISSSTRSIHIKGYGNLKIEGYDGSDVIAKASSNEDTTLIETGGIIYITTLSKCDISLPRDLPIIIEKSLGSVKVRGITAAVKVEKVLGNIAVDSVHIIEIEKVGGNCSIQHVIETARIEKIGGNLMADNFHDLLVDKTGGSCKLNAGSGKLSIGKVGGSVFCKDHSGSVSFAKIGGDFMSNQNNFGLSTNVGGDVKILLSGTTADTSIRAGGNMKIYLPVDLKDIELNLTADGEIVVDALGIEYSSVNEQVQKIVGEPVHDIDVKAGGNIHVVEVPWNEPGFLDIFKSEPETEEPSLNELIYQQVKRATDMASKKVEEAQKNLEQIQIRINVDNGEVKQQNDPEVNSPFDLGKTSPKKVSVKTGASDEERLLILKMLQEKKITVDQAEKLFRSLEK